MAKSKAIARPEARHRRRTAADQEQMTRYLILGGVVAVIVIAAGIIAFGWYQTQIKPLGKTVLQVGSMKYSLGDLEDRMDMMQEDNPTYYSGQRLLLLATDAIIDLTDEAKVLQTAGQLNLTITDEEFASEIKNRGNVSQDAAPDVYASAYAELVDESGLDEGDFNNMVKAGLLEQKLSDYFAFVAKPSEAMVTAKYAFADNADDANELASRVRAGEDFDTVAAELVAQSTGTLDWAPRGASFLPEEVEGYLFDTATPGQVDDPIEKDGVFYVVQLTERDPNRALDDQTRRLAADRDKEEWLDDQNVVVTESLSDKDEARAIEDIL